MRYLSVNCARAGCHCLSDTQPSACPAVSLPNSPSTGDQGQQLRGDTKTRGAEQLEHPKTSVGSDVATPAHWRQALGCTVRAGRERRCKDGTEVTGAPGAEQTSRNSSPAKHSRPATERSPGRHSPALQKVGSSLLDGTFK